MTAARDVEISVTDARSRLPELLDAQARDGGIVYLTRYGHRVGALVSADVAENLDAAEDAYWSRRANEALERLRHEPAVPWNEALVELEGAGTNER